VWELAAAGLPAILVPYPVRHRRPPDAQRALLRARRRRDPRAGDGARRRPELARSLLDDPDGSALMAERMRALARPDAAQVIAEELIALAAA
jgi:UDP-N-acetylglucosamine--N-acetylmuramyl-(pentapeptide) pyrophosphoryl-undecaprenol N-acetylglucosamine transferase